MKKKRYFEAVKVATPCTKEWNEMIGNDRVRFCSHCAKDVNNISAMTAAEAMRLVRRSGGRLCVRYRTDPKTNAPIFAERVAKFVRHGAAVSVLGASLLGVGGTDAQEPAENVQLVQIERPEKTGGATATISGYVTDPQGAAIPYALVTLTNQETMMSRVQNASDAGFFEFKDLDAGKYKLRFEAGGFAVRETGDVYLSDASEARHDGQLSVAQFSETVEVKSDAEVEHYVTVGVIAVSLDTTGPPNELVSAAMEGDLENVKARIIMGAKINVRDKSRGGISPLHAAVQAGNLEIVEYLLVHGAKPNIRNSYKQTPAMFIEEDETALEMARLLVRYGAKLSLMDKEKNTVLHHLADSVDDPDLVREAIANGAKVNAVNKDGKTALMIAVDEVNTETVEVLLQSGADVNVRDREGKTALDYASEELEYTRSLLVPYGAISGGRP